jgi:hypothetical protein
MTWTFQHITHVGTTYTDNETITAVDSIGTNGKAWLVPNTTACSATPDSDIAGQKRNNDDISFRAKLSSTTNAQFNFQTASENKRVYATVWEQPSTASTDKVNIERIGSAYMSAGQATRTLSMYPTAMSALVAFRTHNRSNTTSQSWDDALLTAGYYNSYNFEWERGGTGGHNLAYTPCVEFQGSDYTVATGEITSFTAGTTKTTTITSVDWTETIIIAHIRVASGSTADADSGFLIWPGSNGTSLNCRLHADHSDATNAVVRYFLISSAEWFVDHDNSIDGNLSQIASGTNTENIDLSDAGIDLGEMSATSTAAPFCYAMIGGTGSNMPRGMFTYGITSTTNLRFWRGKTGAAADIAVQILDTDPDNRPGGATLISRLGLLGVG